MKVPCKYSPGDKIFAKVKGFVYWPARVNPLPADIAIPPNKIPIFFYGTHEVYFISPTSCWPYDEKNKSKWGKPRSRAYFNQGMDEIENYSTIYQYGVDPLAENFLSQFYEFTKSNGQNSTPTLLKNEQSVVDDNNDDDHDEEKEVIKKPSKKRNKSGSSASIKENKISSKSGAMIELSSSEIKLENITEVKDETSSMSRKRRISESALSSKENKSNDGGENSEGNVEMTTRKRQISNSSSVEPAKVNVSKPRKLSRKKSKSVAKEEVKKEKVLDDNETPSLDFSSIPYTEIDMKSETMEIEKNPLDNSVKCEPVNIENSFQTNNSIEQHCDEIIDLKPTTRCRTKSSTTITTTTKLSNNLSHISTDDIDNKNLSDHDSESPSVDSDNLADEDFRPATKVKRITKKPKQQKPAKLSAKKTVNKSSRKPSKSKGASKKKIDININSDDSLSSISSVEDFKTKIDNQKKEYEEKLKSIQLQQLEMEEIIVKEASKRTKAKRMSDSLVNVDNIDDVKEKLDEIMPQQQEPQQQQEQQQLLSIETINDNNNDCKLEKEIVVNIYKTDIIEDNDKIIDHDKTMNEIIELKIEENLNKKENCDVGLDKLKQTDTSCHTDAIVIENVIDLTNIQADIDKDHIVKDDDDDQIISISHHNKTQEIIPIQENNDNIIDISISDHNNHDQDEIITEDLTLSIDLDKTTSKNDEEKIKKAKINLKDTKSNKTSKKPVNRKRNRKIALTISSDSEIEENDIKQKDLEPKLKRTKIIEKNTEYDDNNKKEMKIVDKHCLEKLQNYNTDIRSSLVLGHEDYKICLERFKSLCEMDIDLLSLVKVWQLMDTVKKCRRYKRNEQIKQEAQAVYKRFMDIYSRATKEEINSAQSLLMHYRHQNNIQNQNVGNEFNKTNGNTAHIPISVADMFQNKISSQNESNPSKNNRPTNIKEDTNTVKSSISPTNIEEISKSRLNLTEDEINEEKMRLLSVDLEAKVSDILNKIEKNVDLNPINQRSLSHLLPSSHIDTAVIKLPTQWKTVNSDKSIEKDKDLDEEISDEEDVEAVVRRIEEVAIELTEGEKSNLSTNNVNSSALDVRIENLINSSFISAKESRPRKSRNSSRHKNSKTLSPVRTQYSKTVQQPETEPHGSNSDLPITAAVTVESDEQKDDIEIYDLLGV